MKKKKDFLIVNIYSEVVFQGGGTGGSIRDAGGAFGKRQAAREEEYFRNLVKMFYYFIVL